MRDSRFHKANLTVSLVKSPCLGRRDSLFHKTNVLLRKLLTANGL